MTDNSTPTMRVADIATTGQDRVDGPVLLDAIRAAIDEHGAVRLSFKDFDTVTPTLVNEAMVPLLEDSSIETLRSQVLLVDVTRPIADMVRRCMEHGVRWNAGEFDTLAAGDISRLPVLQMEKDEDGRYQVVGDLHLPADLDPFARACDLDDATLERLIQDEDRPSDPAESAFERMMLPTLRDRGITVIRCGDDRRDMMERFEKLSALDLPSGGYDYRARNAAPRSYRRR